MTATANTYGQSTLTLLGRLLPWALARRHLRALAYPRVHGDGWQRLPGIGADTGPSCPHQQTPYSPAVAPGHTGLTMSGDVLYLQQRRNIVADCHLERARARSLVFGVLPAALVLVLARRRASRQRAETVTLTAGMPGFVPLRVGTGEWVCVCVEPIIKHDGRLVPASSVARAEQSERAYAANVAASVAGELPEPPAGHPDPISAMLDDLPLRGSERIVRIVDVQLNLTAGTIGAYVRVKVSGDMQPSGRADAGLWRTFACELPFGVDDEDVRADMAAHAWSSLVRRAVEPLERAAGLPRDEMADEGSAELAARLRHGVYVIDGGRVLRPLADVAPPSLVAVLDDIRDHGDESELLRRGYAWRAAEQATETPSRRRRVRL